MIRINLSPEPQWLDLGHGVRLLVGPLSTALMLSARADPAIEALPGSATPAERALDMAKAIARRSVLDWEGVGDNAGNRVSVSPEGIDALLDIVPIFEAFQIAYVARDLLLVSEKNGFALSPNGPSAGATATAMPAKARARTARNN